FRERLVGGLGSDHRPRLSHDVGSVGHTHAPVGQRVLVLPLARLVAPPVRINQPSDPLPLLSADPLQPAVEVFGPRVLHVVAQTALADGVEQPHHISVRRVVVHQSSSGTVNPAASSATRAWRRYRSRSAARSRSQVDLATPENPSGRVSSRSLM